MTRTALSVRAGELVRAAQALPTAKSADTLYEMIAAGAATLRPGVVTTLQLVDGDGVRLAAIAPSQASVSELDTDHARRVLNAASPLLIRGKRAGEGSYYGLLLADTEGAPEAERQAVSLLVEQGVDGVIWFPIADTDTVGRILDGTPTVVLDRDLRGYDVIQADYVIAADGAITATHSAGSPLSNKECTFRATRAASCGLRRLSPPGSTCSS